MADPGDEPAADHDEDEQHPPEERLLPRQKAVRSLAEQTWREFFVSLGIRTLVILGVVLLVFIVLTLIFRR